MSGALETIVADTLHARSMGNRVGAAFLIFKTLPSIPDHYSNTPLLQHSITTTTPGSEGTRLVPFQGAPNKAASSGRGFFTDQGKRI